MPSRVVNVREDRALFDLVSYGRRGPGRTDRLSPAQIEQVARTVRRVPEVMIKVSGGGTSLGAATAHFRYIGREDFEIETDDGERLTGKGAAKKLIDDWDLKVDAAEAQSIYSGKPGRKPAKLVHNIVLSMPAGTPPEKLLAASRDFARETFALQHRYAMVLHTNEPHPHVHLVVRAMSERGERLNIRKVTLREWRREFARHLRAHGVAANATDRVIRGVTAPRKRDAIYRAHQDGRSTHTQQRSESVRSALAAGNIRVEPGKADLLETRKRVEQGWRGVGDVLRIDGKSALASEVDSFLKEMPPARTEREWIATELLNHTREPRMRDTPASR